MIITKFTKMKIGNESLKRYRELGYNVNSHDEFNIKISDLPLHSKKIIKVKCDYCGNEKEITYESYNLNTSNGTRKYACCNKCAQEKMIETNKKKYGVDNVSKLDIVKQKKVNTCLEHNGVEFPMQSKVVQIKSQETKIEKRSK